MWLSAVATLMTRINLLLFWRTVFLSCMKLKQSTAFVMFNQLHIVGRIRFTVFGHPHSLQGSAKAGFFLFFRFLTRRVFRRFLPHRI